MSRIEDRLQALGLALPPPAPPPGVVLPFQFVRVVGHRAHSRAMGRKIQTDPLLCRWGSSGEN